MLDNALIRLIRQAIMAGFERSGWLASDAPAWGDGAQGWSEYLGWDVNQTFANTDASAWGDAGLTWGDDGESNLAVKQSHQPTPQGANYQPTIYLHKLFDRRYGFPSRRSVWVTENGFRPDQTFDPNDAWWQNGRMTEFTSQLYETTFQLNALVRQDPNKPDGYTASDVLNYAVAILQSESTINLFKQSDAAMLRVGEIRNPQFASDRGGYSASPSFDFVVIHRQALAATVPYAEVADFRLRRV